MRDIFIYDFSMKIKGKISSFSGEAKREAVSWDFALYKSRSRSSSRLYSFG